MSPIFKTAAMLLCLMVAVLTASLNAQEEDLPMVTDVEIEGNRVVSRSLITKHMRVQPGKRFSRVDVNRDIKRLYQLNYFSDIQVEVEETPQGIKVIYQVQENPAIHEIRIRGNQKFKEKKLREQLSIREGELLNENALARDIVTLKLFYQQKGYKQIEITPVSQVSKEEGLVNVTLEIKEGKKIRIKRINILGAENIKERKVLKAMKTKKRGWLINAGLYEEKKFRDDMERIKALYYQRGFVDIKILDIQETLIQEGTQMIIDITLSEGGLYTVGDISIEGNTRYDTEEILVGSGLKRGQIYLPEKMSEDIKHIRHFYFLRGYIDAKVGVNTFVAGENVLSIRYSVKEGEIAFVDKILIRGNTKTRDRVIRRELNIRPGEQYDGVRMEVAKQRLSNLGLFKKVDVYADPASHEKERDLLIDVEEERTGELSFGAGFSSVEDLIGFLEVSQSNFDLFNPPSFTGDAQKLKFRTEFGSRKEEFLIDFVEPWMFNRRLLFGVRLFARDRSFKNSDFEESRKGFTLRLARPIFKFTRGEVRYSFEDVTVENVDPRASELLRAQEGTRQVGKVGLNLTRDVRDAFFNATEGSRISLDLELAGVGGNTEYTRAVFDQNYYWNLWSDHVLITSLRVGAIDEYGSTEEVPIFDRFFLGGPNSIRGFNFRDVGPHDEFGEPIGGKLMYHGTFEYMFPLIGDIKLAGFFDYGYLFEDIEVDDTIVASLGVGVRIHLPIGVPLRFDYGWPVVTDDFNEGESGRFTFDIGHRF